MIRADELVARVTAIDWRVREADFGQGAKCARLMREYLRRAALWVRVLQDGRAGDFFGAGQPDRWSFFDLARRVDPAVRADAELRARMDGFLAEHASSPLTGRICRAALNWGSLADEVLGPFGGLPDPFEPLVGVWEQGGGFWIENGFVDFGECRVRLATWQEYAREGDGPWAG